MSSFYWNMLVWLIWTKPEMRFILKTGPSNLQTFYELPEQPSKAIKLVRSLRFPFTCCLRLSHISSILILALISLDSATSSMDSNLPNLLKSGVNFKLVCCILGSRIFSVQIAGSKTVDDLKKAIKKEKEHELGHLDADALDLWQVSIPVAPNLQSNLSGFVLVEEDVLKSPRQLSKVFVEPPAREHLHIIVRVPPADEDQGVRKRARLDNYQPPQTPPSNKNQAELNQTQNGSPTKNGTQAKLAEAFEPCKDAIQSLAKGEMDKYIQGPISTNPILLLHDLGRHPEMERIRKLFIHDTIHLFNTSGTGKTRLSLDGLCYHWGIYISCQWGASPTSGSRDFEAATRILRGMSTWDQGKDASGIQKNVKAADHAFAMLLCARIFVFGQFVQCLPPGIDPMTARRRWVLLQVMPGCLRPYSYDIFVELLHEIRAATIQDMLDIAKATLKKCYTQTHLFPEMERGDRPFFVVIDEAQVAADYHFFRSSTEIDMRPILRELYRFFRATEFFSGVIIAGTGLSMEMAKGTVGSGAKYMGRSRDPLVFTDTGFFWNDKDPQEAYVRRYLDISGSASDQHLLRRILYWFCGRPRLTASLLELLLSSADVPRHRVLTAFAKHLTGFTISDAIVLENEENPISYNLITEMRKYGRLSVARQLFERSDREDLVQCLVNVLMQWRIGSQGTSIAIEHDMHMLIAVGVGHLSRVRPPDKFNLKTNYPVYIDEPLMILSLSKLFEEQPWTTRQKWIANSHSTARNKSPLGFIFEEVALVVLVENFGGKFTALGDVFHFLQSSSLASRKVTLVSLKRDTPVWNCSPVSWNEGSSDRFGIKAENPTDVLRFLQDPDGKAFLFPGDHMGPDLICFLQDEETMELIIVALQSKVKEVIDAKTWTQAVNSVTPEFFYTVVKEGQRVEYAPVSYPDLSADVESFFKNTLGPEVSKETANIYRDKLCHSTQDQQKINLFQRKTPRFLAIIATPDDEQQQHLEKLMGVSAVLKWELVTLYTSTAEVPKSNQGPVH